jgi:hypothetical protein
MAGKMARKKSKDTALARDRISPFRIPVTKKVSISSMLIFSLPGK